MSRKVHRKSSHSMGLYDPDPRRKSRGRHDPGPGRKRAVPWQLRKWVFGHRTHDPGRKHKSKRSTYDPGYRYSLRTGPRSGTYFIGPKKRRYDPDPKKRFAKARAYARRTGAKVEHGLATWGIPIGVLFAALAGIGGALKKYCDAGGAAGPANYWKQLISPEVGHLWSFDASKDPYYLPNYLAYKFLGRDPNTGNFDALSSAWVIPFWASLAGWIASKFMLKKNTGKWHRAGKVLNPISRGALLLSTIGALALPGCGEKRTCNPPPPSPQNSMVQVDIPKTLDSGTMLPYYPQLA